MLNRYNQSPSRMRASPLTTYNARTSPLRRNTYVNNWNKSKFENNSPHDNTRTNNLNSLLLTDSGMKKVDINETTNHKMNETEDHKIYTPPILMFPLTGKIEEYNSNSRSLKVFCGSWNMGNAAARDIEYFIPSKGGVYDLISIGLFSYSLIFYFRQQINKNIDLCFVLKPIVLRDKSFSYLSILYNIDKFIRHTSAIIFISTVLLDVSFFSQYLSQYQLTSYYFLIHTVLVDMYDIKPSSIFLLYFRQYQHFSL